MALRLQDVKYVDNRSKKLITGYLKEINISIDDKYIVPELVLNACLLFYYQRAFISMIFNGYHHSPQSKDSFTLSKDKRTVSLIDSRWGTLFGNIQIDSLSEIVCRWNVKVFMNNKSGVNATFGANVRRILLGLSAQTEPIFFDTYCGHSKWPSSTYLFTANVKSVDGQTLTWNDGDIIGIKLNLKKLNIEYFVNGKSVGILKEDIEVGEDIKYRLTVSMVHNHQAISIESFEYC